MSETRVLGLLGELLERVELLSGQLEEMRRYIGSQPIAAAYVARPPDVVDDTVYEWDIWIDGSRLGESEEGES